MLPIETAMKWAASADWWSLIRHVAGPWIRDYLAAYPSRVGRLICGTMKILSRITGIPRWHRGRANDVFDFRASRATWEESGLPLPAIRTVVHPGNRNELEQAAKTDRLPWPGSNNEPSGARCLPADALASARKISSSYAWERYQPSKGQMVYFAVGRLLQHTVTYLSAYC